ncbi:MAG: hypothetical protein J6033_07445, partial [Lachnospiraceae bacterium]|nr:hypothetical protein [Lachnospiraceae bacterium]
MTIDPGFEKFKRWRFIVELLPVIAMFFVIGSRIGFWYETNDDYIINGMLAGWFTGEPSFRTIYTGLFYAFPIKCLYDLFPAVGWYGIINLFLYVTANYGILNRITAGAKSIAGYVCRLALGLSVLGLMLRLNVFFQYTSIGIMLAVLGFVILIVGSGRKRDLLAFFICEAVSYGVRPESMEIVQITGFMMYFAFTLKGALLIKKPLVKHMINRVAPALIISALVICIGFVADRISYSGETWQQALETNDARSAWFDYHISPEADEIREILDKNNVTDTEYYAYRYYLNYSWDNSSEMVSDVNDYLAKRDQSPKDYPGIVRSVFLNAGLDWGLQKITFLCVAIVIVSAILKKSLLDLLLLFTLEVSKLLAWGYLYYIGRFPVRIMVPLAICHISMLILIALNRPDSKDEQKDGFRIIKSIMAAGMAGVFLLVSVRSFVLQYRNCA